MYIDTFIYAALKLKKLQSRMQTHFLYLEVAKWQTKKGSGKAEKNSKFQQFGSLCQLRKRILVKNCFNLDICSIIR